MKHLLTVLIISLGFCNAQAQITLRYKTDIRQNNSGIHLNYKTSLKFCPSGSDCLLHGLPLKEGAFHLAASRKDDVFQFVWETEAPEIDGICWQVSTHNFEGMVSENPFGLIKTGKVDYKQKLGDQWKGNFTIDFSKFVQQTLRQKKKISSRKNMQEPNRKLKMRKNISVVKKPDGPSIQNEVVYYFVRVMPVRDNVLLQHASNTIILRFDDYPEDAQIEYVKAPKIDFPNLYSLSIDEFKPIQFASARWGTSRIVGFDEAEYDKVKALPGMASQRKAYEEKKNKGQLLYCDPYKGVGSDSWYESLWDAATSAADWVSEAYEWPKEQLVNAAASMLDQLPGIDCDASCKDLLKKGLDAGLVAIGVPPALPNADELMEDGLDYLAAQASAQIGCGELCKDVLKEQIENLGESLTKQQRALVNNADEAHKNGCEPLQVPNWVQVKIVPESSIQPPQLKLSLNRNFTSVLDSSILDRLYIRVSFSASNRHYKKGDKVLVPVNTDYKDDLAVNYHHESLTLPQTPFIHLFSNKLIPIPPLENGESITFSVFPEAQFGYLFPGHYDLICAAGGHIFHDDWAKMYMDGTLQIKVDIVGQQLTEYHNPVNEWEVLYSVSRTYQLPNEFPAEFRPRRVISCFH
jgi:hypothetical protein